MTASKRKCTNASCYLHPHTVVTELTACLACGRDLKAEADIFADMFKDFWPGGPR